MRQENSVLFALRDLRSIEAERCADELRAEEQRRLAAAAEQHAEEERQRAAEAERRREEADRDALASTLREAALRNAALESDVLELRALVAAARPPEPRRAPGSKALFVTIVAAALVALALAMRRPTVHERVVYLPAPAPPIVAPPPAPSLPAPSPAASTKFETPRRPSRSPSRIRTPAAAPAAPLPRIDDCGGKDPLCGTKL